MRRASLIVGALISFLFADGVSATETQELPQGPGRALVYGQCRTCHDLQYLKESTGIPRSAWNDIIDSMTQYGLRLSADQRARILEYLGTYLSPSPPQAATAPVATASSAKGDGGAVYREQCASCHQIEGQGVAGQFPPLAHNPDIFLARDFPVRVVLFGLTGKILVDGKTINGAMPPFYDVLSDAEIAAVVAYVRNSFGNAGLRPTNMPRVDAALVSKLRQTKLSPKEVHDDRGRLERVNGKQGK